MTSRFADHILGPDTHANRPAAGSTPKRALYECTTHGKIYYNDGSAWQDWATLGAATTVATDTIWDTAGDLAVATAADTAAKLAIGTNGQVLTVDTSLSPKMKWATPSGGSGGSGPLAYTSYAPPSAYTTTSTSYVQVDATNLAVTFTAPTSGRVMVTLSALAQGPSSPQYGHWSIFESGSNISGSERQFLNSGGGLIMSVVTRHVITGLTGGSSHTYKWGWKVSAGTGTIHADTLMTVDALP